jgi:hypothetical protein
VTSERFIAGGFCVSRIVVTALLDELEKSHMISRRKGHGGTVITICNYEKYQSAPRDDEPADRPPNKPGTDTGHQQATGQATDMPPGRPPVDPASGSNDEEITPSSGDDRPLGQQETGRRVSGNRPNKKEENEENEYKSSPKAIVWEGTHGRRLNQKNWGEWRAAFSNLSEADFRRELMKADGYYGEEETRWFFRFSTWLERANNAAKSRGAFRSARPNSMTPEGRAAIARSYEVE